MRTTIVFAAALASALFSVSAAGAEETAVPTNRLHVVADVVAADNITKAMIASGNVHAVSYPMTLRGETVSRDLSGTYRFAGPTAFTTCTNCVGSWHWSMAGELEYTDNVCIKGRDMVLRFWEIPVMWLPYWYYPLATDYGWRVMPGYKSRWGAYLLTKYVYHIAGDPYGTEGGYSLRGSTRFDLRTENGVALGQGLRWQLGEFGKGHAKVYYAWDEDWDRYERNWDRSRKWNYRNWGSTIERDRYAIQLAHRWDPTERDSVRVKSMVVSDSHFNYDFLRDSLFNVKSQWLGVHGNELAWEHGENDYSYGVSVAGPLNEFYDGTMRLPEFYFDVNPMPVWTLPLNYESQTRAGYLRRRPARYGDSDVINAYSRYPGEWATYGTFRLDTYHRLTAPFKLWDALSVVPRAGYRGTWWNETGNAVIDGKGKAGRADADALRSIVEGGVTFAGRGTAAIDSKWRHMLEPYFDVTVQKADYSGLEPGARPYVFDNIDMSRTWEDQFAGRGRELPHSYHGVTPGLRNAFISTDEKGNSKTVFDVDTYIAVQFNEARWFDERDEDRMIARPGRPNYGDGNAAVVPGVRARWLPSSDIMLAARTEYDCENDVFAVSDIEWRHRLSRVFNYHVSFNSRDHRWWDYSICEYDPQIMNRDSFNWFDYGIFEIGFEHEICDAVVWSPFIRWDCAESELDEIGTWVDLRTDCLGFRFIVSYEEEYTRIDGSERGDDWSFGFFVYLRAFGPDSGAVFGE
jgi:hypothetical protein